jgi:hypothetical protein
MKTQNHTPQKHNLNEVEKNQSRRNETTNERSEKDYSKSDAKADGLKKPAQQDEKANLRTKTTEKGRATSDRENEKQDQKAKPGKGAMKH